MPLSVPGIDGGRREAGGGRQAGGRREAGGRQAGGVPGIGGSESIPIMPLPYIYAATRHPKKK